MKTVKAALLYRRGGMTSRNAGVMASPIGARPWHDGAAISTNVRGGAIEAKRVIARALVWRRRRFALLVPLASCLAVKSAGRRRVKKKLRRKSSRRNKESTPERGEYALSR